MTLYIGSIVINVTNIQKGVDFWTKALGYEVSSGDNTFVILKDPNRRWSNVSLQLTPAVKKEQNRLHLDLYTNQQEAEVLRLEHLGAVRIPWSYPSNVDFVVMADPEGNEFCVIQTDKTQ